MEIATVKTEDITKAIAEDDEKTLMGLISKIANKMMFWKSAEPTANEASNEEVRRELQAKVDTLDIRSDDPQKSVYHFVQSVYKNYFVYGRENADGVALFKQGYSADKDGKVELTGEPEEVRMKTEYVKANQKQIDEEVKRMEKEKVVEGLIANEATNFTGDDKDWLMGLSDCQLTKLTPQEPTGNSDEPVVFSAEEWEYLSAVKAEMDRQVNNQAGDDSPKPRTIDEYIAEAPAEMQEILFNGVNMHRTKKDNLVKGLLANKRNEFSEDQLRSKPLNELEALAKLANVPTNFVALAGGAGSEPQDKKAAPDPPVVNWQEG